MYRPELGPDGCWLAIISASRPDNVPDMSQKAGGATWSVPPDQTEYYDQFGVAPEYLEAVARSEDLPGNQEQSRNTALDHAQNSAEGKLPCVMLDDDIQKVRLMDFDAPKSEWRDGGDCAPEPPITEVTVPYAIDHLLTELAATDYRYAGPAPTDNPFFVNRKQSTDLFFPSQFIAIEPTPLRFDEQFVQRADYDFLIRNLKEYGGVCRLDQLLVSADYGSAPGGLQDYRTAETNRDSIEKLKAKHPDYITDHPSRAGEVKMQPP